MVRSMTGFGRAETVRNGTRVTVEVHSVNGRFLDLKMKLPRQIYEYESELRTICQRSISRGRVSLAVYVDRPAARAESRSIDLLLAERYIGMAEELHSRFGCAAGMDARAIMLMPDVIRTDEEASGDELLWDLVAETAREAFRMHRAMREKEGDAIGADVTARLNTVSSLVEGIHTRAPEIAAATAARLREKIAALLDGDFDETRFAMETAVYANRADITEECVRFASHCELFEKETATDTCSGKKLSFLLQEMVREANTITSKSSDADIAQTIVVVKEELEKMREQVENME